MREDRNQIAVELNDTINASNAMRAERDKLADDYQREGKSYHTMMGERDRYKAALEQIKNVQAFQELMVGHQFLRSEPICRALDIYRIITGVLSNG